MRPAGHVLMGEGRLDCNHRFCDNVFDSFPDVYLSVFLFDVVKYVMEIPFVSFVLLSARFIVIRVFIDSVVGKVHIDVFKIALKRRFIRNSGKSSKAFFMNKNSQRRHTIHQDIDSKVKLKFINE